MDEFLYNISINVVYAVKHNISFEHCALIKFFLMLPNRADKMEHDGITYYRANMTKIHSQLPMLSHKNDTVYRYIKKLIDLGIVQKVPKVDYYRVTSLGIQYEMSKVESGVSEINPMSIGNKSDEVSEINPMSIGNKSDEVSEINPTYNNTINNNKKDNILPNGNTPDGVGKNSDIIPLDEKKEYGDKTINEVITTIKEACKEFGVIYGPGPKNKERQCAKHLSDPPFLENISHLNMDLKTFLRSIIKASSILQYAKPANSAKNIYYNRPDIVDKAQKQKMKTDTDQATKKKVTYLS